MFDLDKALAAWRRPYAHDRAFRRDDLDELEGHLRDRVEALVAAGRTEEEAFAEAVRRMGGYGRLETEYRKVRWDRPRRVASLRDDLNHGSAMFKSYVVLALRNLRREKGYAAINVVGLAVALACVLLVFLYVRHEFSFDRFHAGGDRIYRIAEYRGFNEKVWDASASGDPVPALRTAYPEVEAVALLHRLGQPRVELNGQVFREVPALFAEPGLFDVLTFPLLDGEGAALARPNTAVISRSLARRAFGEGRPVGKTFDFNVFGQERAIEIVGVLEDVPANSHLDFDLLLSYETLRSTDLCLDCGGNIVFVRLKPGARPEPVAARLLEHVRTVDGKEWVEQLRLLPLHDVYFSGIPAGRNGDRRYVYLLSTIALVMLLIACANYMNLATARSARRAKEVGIRKAVGAHRGQVARQFLVEGVLLVALALPLAVVLLAAALPFFNTLASAEVPLDWGSLWPLLLAAAGLLVLTGVVGGGYPALYLSAFRPIEVLKGTVRGGVSAAVLRKGLVVFQFAASVVLLVATLVVLRQLAYVQEKALGFDADQVVMVYVTTPGLFAQNATLKEEVLRIPGVAGATAGHSLPGAPHFGGGGWVDPLGKDGPQVTLQVPHVDADFIRTMRIPLVAGRNLTEGLAVPGAPEGLLNEVAVRALGWASPEEALGKKVGPATVVGVVGAFHFESLHHPVAPLLLLQQEEANANLVGVRLRGGAVRPTLAALERAWKRLDPAAPFEFSFLRDEMNKQYERERRAAQVFGTFAGLAIGIACLGLFGLAAFTAEQRTKEIGIRKVLGATVPGLLALLSRDFVQLVAIAFVVAGPVAYVAMDRWLADFAYRVRLGPTVFLLAGAAALVVALVSVGSQAIRAARTNPVDSLRYE